MANKTVKAKIKATGATIVVYKLNNGKWCNYEDCNTTYDESELEFI